MNWLKFEDKLLSWHLPLKKFILSEECDQIFAFLKATGKNEHVFPSSDKLWRPFQLCDYKELKVVIVCEGPYLEERGDGLALSWEEVPYDNLWIPKPLECFYEAIEEEIHTGLCLECMKQPSLEYLAKQGVLLLNAPMTGDKENGSHTELWHPFFKFLLEEALSYTGVPVVFIGRSTWKYEKYLTPWQERWTLKYPHPGWDTKRAFSKIQEIVKQNNGESIEFMEMLPF